MSDFSTDGHESYPNLYFDGLQVGEFSTWPQQPLNDLYDEYTAFLRRDDVMPHHREQAGRIAGHIVFELMWRDGAFKKEENGEC
jgi:hypothetical protein